MPATDQDFWMDAWHIQPRLNRATGPEGTIHLEPQVMRVLRCLVERPGDVLSRDELLANAWPDTIVNEEALTRAIFDLRKAFHDSAQDPRFIETIRTVGYRLIAPVRFAPPRTHGIEALAGDSVCEEDLVVAPSDAPPPPSDSTRIGPWPLVGGLLFVILLVASYLASSPSTPVPLRPLPLTSLRGIETDPALSPDGAQVAFIWNGPDGDNYDIYVKRVDTETPLRLTTHPAMDGSPTWSPDGQTLAYTRAAPGACNLYLRPFPGDDEHKLADCHAVTESALSWSPDGKWIAFTDRMAPGDPFRLYVVSTDTREVFPLTTPPSDAMGDFSPAFSPDGRRLAFVRGLSSGTLFRALSPIVGDIYILSLGAFPDRGPAATPLETTHNTERLTFDHREVPGLYWTADAQTLVFASNRGPGDYTLWQLPITGGTPRQLLQTEHFLRHPSLSRSGQHLAYERWTSTMDIQRLPLAPASDEDPAPVFHLASTRWDFAPQYSPAGTHIAFASTRSGYPELWISDADGKNSIQRTSFEGPFVNAPRWSPDGTRIAFEARANGNADIYLIEATGGQPLRLTTHQADDIAPSWSADGAGIYYGSKRSGAWQIWKSPSDTTPLSEEADTAVQVTTDGGIAAFEAPGPAPTTLYYVRPDTVGLWRRTGDQTDGELIQPALSPSDWGSWLIRDQQLFFIERTASQAYLAVHDLKTHQKRSILLLDASLPTGLPGFSLSPDGQWLLITHQGNIDSDIMLINDFHYGLNSRGRR